MALALHRPGRPLAMYSIIVARLPCVGSFGSAMQRARKMKPSGGVLSVCTQDFVEIRKRGEVPGFRSKFQDLGQSSRI